MSRLQRIRNFFNRYINGTRGAVSLLLILVMSPLLSVSVMLVESSRYQNAVQLMEEIMDSSAFSTLAEYDPYLENRFGLLGASQEATLNSEFRKYLNANTPALGKSVTVNQTTATGAFPLSKAEVLKQQVLENSEITVATEAVVEGFDIDALLDKLGDLNETVDQLEDEVAAVDAGVDVAKEVENLVQSIEDSLEQGKVYESAFNSYRSSYSTFKSKALAYIAALQAVDSAAAAYNQAVADSSAASASSQSAAASYEEAKTAYDVAEKAYQDAKKAYEDAKKAEESLAWYEFNKKGEAEKKVKETEKAMNKAKTARDEAFAVLEAAEGSQTETSTAEGSASQAETEAEEALEAAKEARDEALDELKSARTDYERKTGTLKTELEELRDCVDALLQSINALPEKLEAMEAAVSDEDTTASSHQWFLDIMERVTASSEVLFADIDGAPFLDSVGDNIEELGAQKDTLKSLQGRESSTITTSWNAEDIEQYYGQIEIVIPITFVDDLNALLKALNSFADMDEEDKAIMSNLLTIADGLMQIDGFYDKRLNSVVSASVMHRDLETSFTGKALIAAISDYVEATQTYEEALDKGSLLKVLKGVVKLFEAVFEFLGAVLLWVGEFVAGFIVNGVTKPISDLFNSMLIAGYASYNLPSRIDYDSGESLAGYSYRDIFKLAGGKFSGTGSLLGGSISDLGNFSESGSDKMFKGAHTEYVLVGSKNELANQSVAFFDLYMLRLMLDFIPVLTDKEAAAMSAAAGPASLAVKIAMVMAEPMLDTIFLVNGEDVEVPFIKTTVYLTPSGIEPLLEQCNKLVDFDMPEEDTMEETVEKAKKKINYEESGGDDGADKSDKSDKDNGKDKNKVPDLFNLSYKEHMMVMLMIKVGEDKVVKRLQNLIQMETAVQYQDEGGFDLDKAYTYVKTDVKYTLNPMFHIDSLTENGFFTAVSSQYTGY